MDNNDVTFTFGGSVLTNIQPGFWTWIHLHPFMTLFICLALASALEEWGKSFGKRKNK